MSLDKTLDEAFKACARVTGRLALAMERKSVTPRVLVEQVEQLKFATNRVEEAIALLPTRRQSDGSAH